jgi:hypothetical protein
MSTSMPAKDWLSVLRKEYLQDFIKSGGAAVKFVVQMDCLEHDDLVEQLRLAAEEDGYLFVSLDSATIKTQMIDRIFHAIAREVAWEDLAYAFLRSILSEKQYLLPDDRNDFRLAQIAALNANDLGVMRFIINSLLKERLFQDYAMTQEFRTAMMWLCRAQIEPDGVATAISEGIKDWLRGELKPISTLKSALIFQKIGRHNGRHMLSSLSHWLHVNGITGLVLNLDISRYLETNRPKEPDGSLYYNRAMVIDGYEVLRQFIDDTDDLHYCLIVVLAPSAFLDSGNEKRSLHIYDALKLRIWDEVHDRKRTNPLSSLVRLSRHGDSATLHLRGGSQ